MGLVTPGMHRMPAETQCTPNSPQMPAMVRLHRRATNPGEAPASVESRDRSAGNIVIAGGGPGRSHSRPDPAQRGIPGPVTLIGAEVHHPYLRPPLSKEYLLGKAGEEAVPVAPGAWYAEHDVDLRLGVQVAGIDAGRHTVRLSNGDSVGYGSLLLATGALPRHLPLPGSTLDGVSTFRTLDDSRRLRDRLSPRRAERRDDRLRLDRDGTCRRGQQLRQPRHAARPGGHPAGRRHRTRTGPFFRSLHEAHGVQFRLPASAAGILGRLRSSHRSGHRIGRDCCPRTWWSLQWALPPTRHSPSRPA